MSLKDLDLSGKKVLVRVDFNVPLDAEKNVTDDTRISKAAPTIKYLLENGAAVILMSHLGRPLKDKLEDGTINYDKYSLKPVVATLEDYVGCQVQFVADTIGEEAKAAVEAIEPGQILLLENTRFYAGEEKGDEDLAKAMADLADFYVNDAFGTAHREHASTATVARFFDADHKSFGFLIAAELEGAEKLLNAGLLRLHRWWSDVRAAGREGTAGDCGDKVLIRSTQPPGEGGPSALRAQSLTGSRSESTRSTRTRSVHRPG